jgi:hypothetical protein
MVRDFVEGDANDRSLQIRGEPVQVIGPDGRVVSPTQLGLAAPRIAGILPPRATGDPLSQAEGIERTAEHIQRVLTDPEYARDYPAEMNTPAELEKTIHAAQLARYLEQKADMVRARGFATVTQGPKHLLGSVVADAEGNPLRVYHGTTVGDFAQFDPALSNPDNLYGPAAAYFTEEPRIAGGYASGGDNQDWQFNSPAAAQEAVQRVQVALDQRYPNNGITVTTDNVVGQAMNVGDMLSDLGRWIPTGGNIRPVYLDIRHPFDIDARYTMDEVSYLLQRLEDSHPGYNWTDTRESLQDPYDRLGDEEDLNTVSGEQIYNTLNFTKLDELQQGPEQAPVGNWLTIPVGPSTLGKAGTNLALERIGYDGITHIGGGVTGNPPHRVWIPFQASQIHAPWNIGPLNEVDAAGTAQAITKQATVMESATLNDAIGKVDVTEADAVTAAKSTNPGGVTILKNITNPVDVLREHPDVRFVEHDGQLDMLVGPVTDAQVKQYEKYGIFEGQRVVTSGGTEGTIMQLNVKGKEGRVRLKREAGGPPLIVLREKLLPSRFGQVQLEAPDLWDSFKADLLAHANAEAVKSSMAPVEDIWDPRISDIALYHLQGYMDRRGINSPGERQAVEALINQRYIEEAKALDPEMRDIQDEANVAATLAMNEKEMSNSPIVASLDELAAARGFRWVPAEGAEGGMLQDLLNPDASFAVPVESDFAAREFLDHVDRTPVDLTPLSSGPLEVAEELPSNTELDARLSHEDAASQLSEGTSNLSDDLDAGEDILSYLRTGEGKVGAGFDKSLVHKLGANMYKGDVGVVAVKEGIQNAVDAIRSAGGGDLWINYSAKNRMLRIEDNGIGMTPELIETAFVDIGGSGKDALESSGGYGLAKVALFGRADMIDVVSKAWTGGRLIETTLKGSGEDWVSGNMSFRTREVGKGFAVKPGTTVELTFPRDLVDDYQMRNFLEEFTKYSRLPDVAFKAAITPDWGDVPLDYELGKGEPMKPEDIGDFTVPGARIQVYESQARSTGTLQIAILNRGVYQFTRTKYPQNKEGLPKVLVVDVHPNVGIEDPNYPFTTSREELKKAAADKVDDIVKKATTMAGRKEISNITEEVYNSPRMLDGKRAVIADDPSFSVALKERVAKFKPLNKLADKLEGMMSAVVFNSTTAPLTQKDWPAFGGLGVAKGWLGLNVRLSGLGEMGKEVGLKKVQGSADQNLIYINPFVIYSEVKRTLQWEKDNERMTASRMAEQMWGTMVHEVSHQMSRGHGTDFAGVLTRLLGDVARLADPWISDTERILADMLESGSDFDFFQDIYTEVQNEWTKAGTERTLGKISDELARQSEPDRESGALSSYEARLIARRVEGRLGSGEGGEPERGTALRRGEAASGGTGGAGAGGGGSPPSGASAEPGRFDPLNPKLLGGTSLGTQFARLRTSDPAKFQELSDRYRDTQFRYTRYLMAGLENELQKAGVSLGRAWVHYEAAETARILSDNAAHDWLTENGQILKQFPHRIMRDGTVTRIHEIQDPIARYDAWYRLRQSHGYSDSEIRGFTAADRALTEFNHKWFEFLVGDPAYALTAEREIAQYVSHVRAKQARQDPNAFDSRGYLSPTTQFFAEYAREGNMQFRVMDIREIQNHMIRAGMFHKYQAAAHEQLVRTWQDPRVPDSIQKLMLDHARALKFGYDPQGDMAVKAIQVLMKRVLNTPVTRKEAEGLLAAPVSGMYMSMLAGRTSIFFRDALQPLLSIAKVDVPVLAGVYRDLLSRNRLSEMYQRGVQGGWIPREHPSMEAAGIFEQEPGMRSNELLYLTPKQIRNRERLARVGDVLNELPAWLTRPSESNFSTLKWYGKQQQLHRLIVGEAAYRQAKTGLEEYRRLQMKAALTGDPDAAMTYKDFARRVRFSSFNPTIRRRFEELVQAGQNDEEVAKLFAREVDNWVNHKYNRREQPKAIRGGFGRLAFTLGNFTGQFAEAINDVRQAEDPWDAVRTAMVIGAVTLALKEATAKTGWSFDRFAWGNAFKYAGGPLFETAAEWMAAAAGAIAWSDERTPSPAQKAAMEAIVGPNTLYGAAAAVFPYTGYIKTEGAISDALQTENPLERIARYAVTGDRGDRVDWRLALPQRANTLYQQILENERRRGTNTHPGNGAIP